MTHADMWNAIDSFARSRNMTCSCMARRSGLDSTTLNRSKRWTRDGKPRWPSMQSLAKVLDSNDAYMIDFARFAQCLMEKKNKCVALKNAGLFPAFFIRAK